VEVVISSASLSCRRLFACFPRPCARSAQVPSAAAPRSSPRCRHRRQLGRAGLSATAIAGNVRVMLCMTRGSVFTTQDCEEYLARLPDVYKREVIRSFKEHRPLDLTSLG
jgi:hypothetical protein